MDRRKFLKSTGTFIAGATIARSAFASARGESSPAMGRLVLPINRNWRYSPTVAPGAHERTFDDSGFGHIIVPHTNSARALAQFRRKDL